MVQVHMHVERGRLGVRRTGDQDRQGKQQQRCFHDISHPDDAASPWRPGIGQRRSDANTPAQAGATRAKALTSDVIDGPRSGGVRVHRPLRPSPLRSYP